MPMELSRSISRRLSGSAPEPVRHVHRAATFFARSSPFRGSGEEEERQRLGCMLASYGLCERLVKGDGNCQVRCRDRCYDALCVLVACHCLTGRVPVEQHTMCTEPAELSCWPGGAVQSAVGPALWDGRALCSAAATCCGAARCLPAVVRPAPGYSMFAEQYCNLQSTSLQTFAVCAFVCQLLALSLRISA